MAYADVVLADSPSGYWPFVDGALTDASGNGRTMALYNSPVYGTDGPVSGSTGRYYCNKVASPQISNGMRRSGIALPTDGTCKFTAEFWVKSTEANAGRTLFRHSDTSSSSTTWYIHSAASQKITAGLAGSKSVTSATAVLDGQWHHVVFVIDDPGDAITLYVDGDSDASNTGITVPTQGARYWALGVFSGLTDTAAHSAAHPAVYHGTALSAARVAAHYAAATPPVLPSAHVTVHAGSVEPVVALDSARVRVHAGTITAIQPETEWGYPGGAIAPAWGDNVKLHVWVALRQGNTWTLGPHANDRLDAGNCLSRLPVGGATPITVPDPSGTYVTRLWQELACSALDLSIQTGATKATGVVARAEAGTATVTLIDPDRLFDPLNTSSPWQFQGRSRLIPGCPVLIWSECLQGEFIVRHTLFAGTVDSWEEQWTPHPNLRRAKLVASDYTAELAHRERAALDPPIGAGDTAAERVARILSLFDGPALIPEPLPSTVTLAATDMSGTAWTLINKVADDEIGYVHVTPYYADPLDALTSDALIGVRFLPRSTWLDTTAPAKVFDCPILIAATVDALDLQLRNSVTANRKDGSPVTVRNEQSIDMYGEVGYKATDLGVETDAQAAAWANFVLMMYAFPRPALASVTLRPSAEPVRWIDVLGVDLVAERVLIRWDPPDGDVSYSVSARVVGVEHSITRQAWEVKFSLGAAEVIGSAWTLGPDAQDALDAGNVLTYTTS